MGFTGFSNQIADGTTVTNAAFWPAIDLSVFAEEYRLPGEYREGMLEDRVKLAIIWANGELAGWKAGQVADGVEKLSDVSVDDAPEWDEGPLVLLYVRAVSCWAKSMLLADYATMLRKSDAQSDALEADDTAGRWERMAWDALNAIQGNTTIRVSSL